MLRLRQLLLAVVLAVLAAACTPAAGPSGPDEASASPLPEASPSAQADGAPEPSEDAPGEPGDAPDAPDEQPDEPSEQPDEPAPAPDEEPAPAPAPEPQLTELRDRGGVGTNGPAYLRGDRPRVVLEIDVQDGANLPSSVIDHVRTVLDRESAAAVEVVVGDAVSTRRDRWSVADLEAAAADTRSVAHGDDVAVLHLLVLRDEFEEDGVLGLAFDSSTAVVFPDQWSGLTSLLLSGTTIARAVTTHEVGHLLGLVGLAEPPTSDHEDPEHPGHTGDEDDVMFWAIETDVIGTLDGVPDDFGPRTRADLAAMREG